MVIYPFQKLEQTAPRFEKYVFKQLFLLILGKQAQNVKLEHLCLLVLPRLKWKIIDIIIAFIFCLDTIKTREEFDKLGEEYCKKGKGFTYRSNCARLYYRLGLEGLSTNGKNMRYRFKT